ncbi:lysis system i-spanin subunit Rz [Pseudomonas brassicacearum]|uniref:Lysis protein n=1 Tax=Pseudomonas brassicacearum TaxID=930166 RepID=A0A423H077_9PSED|nr:lysis system i-spanin subunit Rz [Pseudomonas brassicacearum]RON05133.1 lysis protein [Pseudomonas brassicacearum]
MNAAAWKLGGVVAVLAIVAGGAAALTWQLQDWRYGQQLAEQARVQGETLNQLTLAAATQQRTEQDKRLALEQRLAASDQTHHEALTNAQKDQTRLRDRLATSDLRLSVLIDAADSAGGCAVPAATGAGGVVHGGARARLDPAHAQRIIGITDAGDQGLIALAACQAFVREVSAPK